MQSLLNVPRCRECLNDRLIELEQLFVGDMFEKRRSHFSGKIERSTGNARLGFFESPGSHALSQREIKNIEKAHDRRELEVRPAT